MVKLRQLRAVTAVAETGQIAKAAVRLNVSQPAISRCIFALEKELGVTLFTRARYGSRCTDIGGIFVERCRRALDHLVIAECELSACSREDQEFGHHLSRHATDPEIRAIVGTGATESVSATARQLGISQPAVNRALRNLEKRLGVDLFQRVGRRMIPSKAGKIVIRRARLCISEVQLAVEEAGEGIGQAKGRIRIGALPLARTLLVPLAVSRMLDADGDAEISIVDGTFSSLLHDLRHGEVDFVVGTIRVPAPAPDICSEILFEDDLVIVARAGHSIHARANPSLADLVEEKWVLPSKGVPLRTNFEAVLSGQGSELPRRVIETDSLAVVRSLLLEEDHLAVVSRYQVLHEEAFGLLRTIPLHLNLESATRPVGITSRVDYVPTRLGQAFLKRLREVAGELTTRSSGLAQPVA